MRKLLEQLLAQAHDYRCTIIENHIVVYHEEPALHETVDNVSIFQQLRGQAARSYIEYISHKISAFQGLSVFLGGALESPIFDEKVTLAPNAIVLEHLCQLLGKNPNVFFWLRYASTKSRYLTFGSTLS